MARGYLGKISAVISANTGDYVRKLNESAKETRAFASTVQNTLGRASKDAAQSLNGIFTPLQKVERALRAAASQKLAFRGFDGAIRDVQSLQAAIAKLTDQKTIDLVVKTSGVGSLEELKRTINVLRNQDVAVGVEGLRQQRASLGNTNNFVVSTAVRDEAARLDAVIEALERIDAERIKQISIQVESQQLDAAALKLRQLVSAGREIGAPLAAAAKQYDSLSLSVQTAFGPALKRAQQAAESLSVAIDSGATISQRKFAALRRDVDLTAAAIKRLAEAEAIIGRLGDGRSLRDVAPRQFDVMNDAARVQQQASTLTGAQAAGFGVGRQEAAVRRQLQILNQMRAERERAQQANEDTSSIDGAIDRQTARLEKQVAVYERLVKAALKYKDAAKTAQDSETARLINRERAALELERNRTPPPTVDQADEIARLINRERGALEAAQLRDRLALADVEIGNPTGPVGPPLPPRFGGASDAGLGAAIEDDARQVERLRGSITATKGQLDQFPRVIRDQFTPALQQAEAEFRRLAALGPSATADEVDKLIGRVRALEESASRTARALDFRGRFGSGGGGLERIFQDQALRGYSAQLDILQGALGRVSAEARGPALVSFARLRDTIFKAFRTGTIESEATQAEIRRLTAEAVAATSAVAGIGRGALSRQLSRAGDIGRAGFDKFGLGIQQAAFAIDDFFSVTGGFEQRIRAVGNNLTQLGFIVGGTTGLFTALAFTAGSQIALALVKFIRGGAESADIAKALNARLETQKRLTQELSDSFADLSEDLTEGAFSAAAKQADGLEKKIASLIAKLRELGDSYASTLDPNLFLLEGRRGTIERSLEGADSVSLAAARQARLRDIQRQVADRQADLQQRSPLPLRESNRRLRLAAEAENISRRSVEITSGAGLSGSGSFDGDAAALRTLGFEELAREQESLAARLRAIRDSLGLPNDGFWDGVQEIFTSGRQEFQDIINASFGPGVGQYRLPRGVGDRQIIQILDERQLELAQTVDSWFATFLSPFEQADARRLINIVAAARQRLETGVADSVRRIAETGINTSGRQFQSATDRAAAILDQARQAGGNTDATRALQSAGEADARRFNALFGQLSKAVVAGREDEARKIVTGIAGLADSASAREREARAILTAANASARFTEVLGRFREINDAILGDVTTAAEQSRRDALQADATASAGLSRRDDAQFAGARNNRLQQELRGAQDRRSAIESRILEAERRFRQESPDQRIRNLVNEAAAARATAESPNASDAARAAARQRELFASQQLDRAFAASPQGRDLQSQLDEADRIARVALERDSMITQGRELALTDGERARRELDDNLRKINAFFDSKVDELQNNDPFANLDEVERQREDALKRAREDAARRAAPAIFGLADSVQNALLQGPSRAALQPTDVSTVEGSRELTRLLRGDDAARDQANLVELQKEANKLLDMIARNPAQIAN